MERQERLGKIHAVLWRTFFLNLATCIIKIILGLVTGVLTITADGIHSLGDSLSNVAGIFAINLARKDPDERYPYGYDKFEAVATLIIASIISITFFEVAKAGIEKLLHPHTLTISPLVFLVMFATTGINIVVVWYEGGWGKRLKSELLTADAAETKSDVFVSLAVMGGVYLISRGFVRMDGVITLVIALFILRIIIEIIESTAKILCDAQVIEPERIVKVVMSVPGVCFCHAVRTRGSENGFFLDFHLGVHEDTSITIAHDKICHEVKQALQLAFPNMKTANVHIEPDNEDGRRRKNSVFRMTDPYGIEDDLSCPIRKETRDE